MSKKQTERQPKGVLVASEGPGAGDMPKRETKFSQKTVAARPKGILVAVVGLGALVVFAWLGSFVVPLPENDGDGFHFKHWVQTNFELAGSAVDSSVMSPYQGLAGLAQPLAVWIHPAYVIPHLLSPGAERACSLFVAMTLMALATYMLGRSNGLPTALAVFGAQLMVMLTFPPMAQWTHSVTHLNVGATFYRTLQAFSVPVALGTMLLAVYSYLGKLSRNGNIICVLLLPALVAYTITIDPLYTAMFFIPIAALLTGVFLGSDNREVLLWRLGGGAFCALVSLVLHLPSFYRGLAGYAARAAFPNELYVEIQKWDYLTTMFFQGGLTSVAIVIMVLSCIATLYFGTPQARGFALAVLGYQWLMILVCIIYVHSGMRWSQPLPQYLEVGAQPAYVVATLLGLYLIALQRRSERAKQRETAAPLTKPWLAYGSVLLLPVIGIGWALSVPKGPPPPDDLHPAAGLTKFLEERLMIGTNGLFRGSVCTIMAVPGGGILNRMGVPESTPFNKNFIGWMEGYGPTFAPDFNMTGLWAHRIPTLEDNNHLVTPAFHFLTSRVLSRPQDYHSRNWAVVTRANPKIMAALGAKFLVTDYELTDPLLTPSGRTSNPDGMTLFIYEIKDANTGGMSPVRTILSTNAAETLSLMISTNVNLNEVAIVHDQALTGLTPADSGAVYFEKGGVRVRAKSHGPSLIVLPVQFSNSLKITSTATNSSNAPIKLVRVNLLQTGVLFNGEVDFKLAHVFGPFRGVKGRLQDIKDCRRMGIKETGEIPYPTDYQPLGRHAVPQ